MSKKLTDLAREIMSGKAPLSEGVDPLENVNDLGPAIVHPLQARGKNYGSGVGGSDTTIPGSGNKGEKLNPTDRPKKAAGDEDAHADSKDKSIPGSEKAGEKVNPTNRPAKAPGDEDGHPGNGSNKKGGEEYNPTHRTQSVKEDEDVVGDDDVAILEDEDKDKDKDSDKKSDDDKSDDDKDDKKKKSKEDSDKAVKEHVDAMLSGENLTEEFQKKAATIFEAAIAERASVIREELEEEFAESLAEAIESIKEDMEGKVEDYMSYVAKEWLKENEVAIESATKVSLSDDFLNGLRALFIEHHIDIPTDKADVVEELSSEVEELEDKLNEEIAKNIETQKEISVLRRSAMVMEACVDLTTTQSSKVVKLAEGIEAESDDEFQTKLNTIREAYSGQKTTTAVGKTVTEDKNPPASEKNEEVDDRMSKYVNVAKRHSPWQSK